MDGELLTRKDTEQIQALLNQNLTLLQENNRLLLNMRKWGRVAFWFKVAIWAVVLIAPLLLLPFVASLLPSAVSGLPGIEGTSTSTAGSLFGLPSPAAVLEVFHPEK
jgi:hypothetical protein